MLSANTVSFEAIANLLHDSWRIVVRSIIGAVLLTLIFLHLSLFTYTISLRLTPVEPTTSVSNMSQLADLVGINSSLGSANFGLYNTALRSSMTAEAITRHPKLMHLIFYKSWSATDQQWIKPQPGPLSAVKNAVKYIVGVPVQKWTPLGVPEVQDFLDNQLAVELDRKSQTIVLTLHWPDPEAAKEILVSVASIADQLLRQRDLTRAQRYSDYAASELERTSAVDYRTALSQLLVQQERRKMVASVDLPFAAQALGAPLASTKPTNPSPSILLFLSIPAGALFGFALAYFRRHFELPTLPWHYLNKIRLVQVFPIHRHKSGQV